MDNNSKILPDDDKQTDPAAAGAVRGMIQSAFRRSKELVKNVHLPEVHLPKMPEIHLPEFHFPGAKPTTSVHSPSIHTPTVHAPTSVHAPSIHAPTVHAPTVHAPTVHAPTVRAPTVHAPTIHAPTVHAPTIHAPTVHAPTVHAPTIHAPAVHAPTIHAPTVHAPTIHAPTVHAPSIHAPSIHAPTNIPVKALGNVTDRLSTALDAVGTFESAAKKEAPVKESRLRKVWNIVKNATPAVVRSTVLGTILFTVYDEGVIRTHMDDLRNTLEPTELDQKYKYSGWPRVALYSAAFGAGAGCVNGFLYSLWNKCSAPRSPCYPVGYMVSHSIVHCALFSSYELMKRLVMIPTRTDYLDYRGLAAVSVVGAAAGSFQEYTNYYTSPLEENGFNKESFRQMKELPRPALRSFTTWGILLPNAFGFLAYEYTKDFILERISSDGAESPTTNVPVSGSMPEDI